MSIALPHDSCDIVLRQHMCIMLLKKIVQPASQLRTRRNRDVYSTLDIEIRVLYYNTIIIGTYPVADPLFGR